MIGLVLVHDLENPLHDRVGHDQLAAQDNLNLRQPALFGQHDDPAQLLKFFGIGQDLRGVHLVDGAVKDPLDEPVNMPDARIDLKRHPPLPLKPAAKHHVVLALIGAVLGNLGLKGRIIGAVQAHRRQHPVERGIAAVFIVEVNRGEHIEIALPQGGQNRQELLLHRCG